MGPEVTPFQQTLQALKGLGASQISFPVASFTNYLSIILDSTRAFEISTFSGYYYP